MKPEVSVAAPAPINDVRACMLQARRAQGRCDWPGAIHAATAVLEVDSTLVAAHLVRALAHRVSGDLEGAVADYTRIVTDLDPGCAVAWEFRGACRSSLAAAAEGQVRLAMLAAAEQDYLHAKELDPKEDRLKLGLIETALCADRPTDALAHAGEAWGTLQTARARLIAAWLGSLAALAAGRPTRTWQIYRSALQAHDVRLGALEWSVVEVNGWLRRLDADPPGGDVLKLADLYAIHELFLGHFVEGGPLLK